MFFHEKPDLLVVVVFECGRVKIFFCRKNCGRKLGLLGVPTIEYYGDSVKIPLLKLLSNQLAQVKSNGFL